MFYTGTNTSIGSLVRKAEADFISVSTNISKYVQLSMWDTINTIYAYLNSKHISGSTDSLNREKPFFNIVTAATNIWYRATDIDRSWIKVLATDSQTTIQAFLGTILLQDWMRREKFGAFLNEWGRVLSRFGSAVTKWVEKKGSLIPSVPAWNRLIVDSIDFENNPKIEILEFTEAQLRQQEGYDQDIVDKLCNTLQARTLMDRQQQDYKNEYIRLYEVHGMLPLSYLTGDEKDEDTFVQQMHVVSFVASKEKGTFDDFTLVSGREEKDPYYITHLIKEDGQTLSIGAVQHLFESQWMMNHTAKSIKDQLDLASKLIFQTSDSTFVGLNALDSIETGDILIHAANQPVTQVENGSHDISSLQSFANQWKALSNEITGISESMLGNTAPSGTAWRQVEALLNQNQSLFELMTENKGLHIEEMMRTYVLPFFKKKLNHSDEIASVLESHDIVKIDSMYIKNEAARRANKDIINHILKGGMVTPDEQANLIQSHANSLKGALGDQGNQRFFAPSEIKGQTWKEILKDLEWDVIVDVTNESIDKNIITTLNTMLATIAKNPNVLVDPTTKLIFNKILQLTGAISPLELSSVAQSQATLPQQTAAPQGQPVPSPMQPQPNAPQGAP